jgi:undecaprenyl-diphosphatase
LEPNLNIQTFRMINDLGKEFLFLNPFFIFYTEYMVIILAVILVGYWFTRALDNRKMVVGAILSFAIAEVLGGIAGRLHSNYQPFAELSDVNQLIEKTVNNSFPSDHTILFFSICVTFYLYKKKHAWLWIIIAGVMGISRIWVGVHYPADVLVGASIAVVAAYLSFWIVPKLVIIERIIRFYEKGERWIIPVKNKSKDF